MVHAGELMAHPVGGEQGGSIFTTILFIMGLIHLKKRGQTGMMWLLVLPFALNLLASAFRLYPYGAHMRLSLYLMPLVCMATLLPTTSSSTSPRATYDVSRPSCESHGMKPDGNR